MKQQEIIENNKLIAEFMELNHSAFYLHPYERGRMNIEKDAKYHYSWHWIMPVVEKIGTTTMHDVTMKADIESVFCQIMCYDKEGVVVNDIFNGTDNLLGCTYGAVVEFINWYNQNK